MLKDKKMLLPPWLAFPEIERYSIGWRMGYGEGYIMKWGTWYGELSEEEKAEYQSLFPEPSTWKGYWKDEDECECYHKGDFYIELWQKEGKPKYSREQLQQEYRAGKKIKYNMFWGHQPSPDGTLTKSCFSQWWNADFFSGTHDYCCMEQFMMAKKAEVFGDEEIFEQILACKDPKKIKALGRKVKNFDEKTWNDVKYAIVLNGNYMKFLQNPDLKKFLLATGDSVLVEASPYDAIWGIKMASNDENATNPLKWRGSNLLGFALMEVRDELRRVCANEDVANKGEYQLVLVR